MNSKAELAVAVLKKDLGYLKKIKTLDKDMAVIIAQFKGKTHSQRDWYDLSILIRYNVTLKRYWNY